MKALRKFLNPNREPIQEHVLLVVEHGVKATGLGFPGNEVERWGGREVER